MDTNRREFLRTAGFAGLAWLALPRAARAAAELLPGPDGLLSIAPGFGQPRPNRRGEARGLHVYEVEADALRILTYIWREDGWGLTAVRTFPRGRQPLAFESPA